MKRLLILAAALIFAIAPAAAQSRVTSAMDNTAVLKAIVADAAAALTDANTNNDAIAAACYAAIEKAAQTKLAAAQVSGTGLLYGFQRIRDLTRLNSSPIGTSLIIGCAPLVQDAKLNMLQFFTQIGGAVLLKGVLF